MKRASNYSYTVKDAPGVNVHFFREITGWSLRELALKCPKDRSGKKLDYTTICRLEHNKGFTQETLKRVARAFGVNLNVFFTLDHNTRYALERMLSHKQSGSVRG